VSEPGFLNANAARCFPFAPGQVGEPPVEGPLTLVELPTTAVVDFGAEVAAPGWDGAAHSVWLAEVGRSGGLFWFVFKTDCPELAADPLVFYRSTDDPEDAASFSDRPPPKPGSASGSRPSASASASAPGFEAEAACPPAAGWWGYLVTGPLDELLDFLAADGVVKGRSVVEKSTVSAAAGVWRVDLYNDPVTAWAASPGCSTSGGTGPRPADGEVEAAAGCLSGDLVLAAGYNATSRADARAGVVSVGASVGAGRGEPCVDLGDGALRCDQVLRTINGAPGPFVSFVGGAAAVVTPEPEIHRITIRLEPAVRPGCVSSFSG
jgi:hypothetical protein